MCLRQNLVWSRRLRTSACGNVPLELLRVITSGESSSSVTTTWSSGGRAHHKEMPSRGNVTGSWDINTTHQGLTADRFIISLSCEARGRSLSLISRVLARQGWPDCRFLPAQHTTDICTSQQIIPRTLCSTCWEELIAYFPLILHGQHTKRRLQQLFVAAGTCLPSYYLAMIKGYTDTHTDSPLIRHGSRKNDASNSSSLPRERVYQAVA
jgi:hypothetical protein